MNFDFLKNITELKDLFIFCTEAEKLACSFPNSSISASRKSMEYIVKLVYGSAVQKDITGLTIFDMIRDYDFIYYLDDKELVDAIHFIRKKGNQCVHGKDFDSDTAIDILKKLHYVVGTICLYLGVIDSFNDFDRLCLSKTDNDTTNLAEPTIPATLIERFAPRLTSVRHFTSLKKVIDVHKSSKKMSKDISTGKMSTGTDSGNNTKVAFQRVAELLEENEFFEDIFADYTRCILSAKVNNQTLKIAVKSGCPTLAYKANDGSWDMLGGINYVLYSPNIKADLSVFEQLRVFETEEFYQMWKSLGLIRLKVSKAASARLESIYGKGFKTNIDCHADSMSVQSFSNSNKKRVALENVIVNYPTISQKGLEKIINKK